MKKSLSIAILFGMILFSSMGWSKDLKVGDAAPDFSAKTTKDQMITMIALKGKWVILYFFPKAFTPGCTNESCALRDAYKEIQSKGAVIYGISLDDLETQKQFKEKYKLPFELISDSGKDISRKYDALSLLGFVTKRITYIVNPDGKIVYIFDNVNPAKHDQQILEELKKLQSAS